MFHVPKLFRHSCKRIFRWIEIKEHISDEGDCCLQKATLSISAPVIENFDDDDDDDDDDDILILIASWPVSISACARTHLVMPPQIMYYTILDYILINHLSAELGFFFFCFVCFLLCCVAASRGR